MNFRFVFGIVLVLTSVLQGFAQTTESANLPGSDYRELVHVGDLIDVDVVGSSDFDWRGEVTADGVLGGLGFTKEPIFARCKQTGTIAKEIADSYGRFLNNPDVRVEILDTSKRPMAVLLGAVRQPQRFNLRGKLTLLEMIVLAGGVSENASGDIEILRVPATSCGPEAKRSAETSESGSVANLLRISISSLLSGEAESNPLIQYGDLVTVNRALPVYVIGSVAKPGKIPISPGLSVKRAIEAAGGFLEDKRTPIIRIFRRNGIKTNIIEVGNSTETDAAVFELSAYDIVEVFGEKINQLRYAPVLREIEDRELTISELPIRVVND